MYKFIAAFALIMVLFTMNSCSSTKEYGNRNARYSNDRIKSNKYANKPAKEGRTYNENKKVQIVKANESSGEYSKSKPSTKEMDGVRQNVLKIADGYLGTKYCVAGKSPSTGFDCSGFTNYVMGEANVKTSGPSQTLATQGRPKPMDELQPGDMVFFGNDNKISHVGIVYSNEHHKIEMIHSSSKFGVRKDVITDSDYWSSRFLFGRDVIGIEKQSSKQLATKD